MKKLISVALALCMALALCTTTAWAATMPAADANGMIKLTGDVVLDGPYLVVSKLTIDLNGYRITANPPSFSSDEIECKDCLIVVGRGGDLTIMDSRGGGMIDAGEGLYNAEGESKSYRINAAVKMTYSDEGATGEAAKLTVNSGTLKGYYYAICGNGGRHGTEITINGGTLTGYALNDHYGIFHPQDGTLTINGGVIEGTTGIEMRAGTLTVTGGTIKSNGYSEGSKTYLVKAAGDGSTTWGAAIAVAEHNTAKGVTVNITGGTIIGAAGTGVALSVAHPQKGNSAYVENGGTNGANVHVNITGGTVTGKVEQNNEQFGDNKPTSVTGGTFDTDVTAFVPTDTAVATNGDDYYVGGDNIAAAANSGKDMTMVQGGAIDGLEPGATIIVPEGVIGTVLNGDDVEWGYYTIAESYHHEPIRRQHTTTTVADTTTPDTKADDTTKTDTVTSAKTFDAGVAVYVGMSLMSVAGTAVVIGKKKEF